MGVNPTKNCRRALAPASTPQVRGYAPKVRDVVVPRLRCPACRARGRDAAFELDPIRVGGGEDGGVLGDVVEAYLVCASCRAAWPVLGGVPVLPADLRAHLGSHGNVYRRIPIADPRLTRFVLGQARGGSDVVPFAEVVARYGDLLPPDDGPARRLAATDAALAGALDRLGAARGPALDVGCGVGRSTFLLAERFGEAVGIDRSMARVRRARNVQSAFEFHLPPGDGPKEVPIDLSRLARERADFAVADAAALPFAAGTFGVVVVRDADAEGPFADLDPVRAEARRVAGPAGIVLSLTADGVGAAVGTGPVS
jgi:SAM-dependent methyltransferase